MPTPAKIDTKTELLETEAVWAFFPSNAATKGPSPPSAVPRHVVILAQVLPAYLEDLEKAVLEGRMEERKLIDFLERLLAVVTTKEVRKVLQGLGLGLRQFFAGLEYEDRPRLRSFIESRLPRVISNQRRTRI
jgi:hypothetical protein